MRLRKLCLVPAAVLIMATVVLPTIASSEPLPVAAVDEGIYYHHWSNSQQTIMGGETIKFSNPYGESEPPHHGLKFTSGPGGAKPNCSGISAAVESEAGAADWHGECTFSTPGTYTFICTVHPVEMKGTITVKNPGEPVATSEAATAVIETAATLHGTVNPEGHETTYFFKYGLTTSYESAPTTAHKLTSLSTPEAVSAPLSGLTPGTTYHFQLVAKNEKGTTEGPDQAFTTASPPGPPSASTGTAVAIGETTATLKGTVNPDGRATEYLFQWGTTEAYGQLTAKVPAGEDHSAHAASATLTSLSPGTLYHFRVLAINSSSEEVLGGDQTFTTLSPESPPSTTATTTQLTPPPSTPPIGSLLAKPEAPLSAVPEALLPGSVKLTAPHSGRSVRGSLEVGQAGAGGRLEVDLLAKRASLAKTRHAGSVRVGQLVRSSVSAGKVSFTVALTAVAKRALARRHRLALTVRITLTPTQGQPASVTRSVTLKA